MRADDRRHVRIELGALFGILIAFQEKLEDECFESAEVFMVAHCVLATPRDRRRQVSTRTLVARAHR